MDAYPQESWDLLLGNDASDSEKFDAIATIPLLMGLTIPTEGTWHLLTSLFMVTSDYAPRDAATANPSDKQRSQRSDRIG